jgi:phosphoribosyl-AMP cyclohydrolase
MTVSECEVALSAKSSTQDVEEGRAFAPRFDADGLVTCVVTDAKSGDVLMSRI